LIELHYGEYGKELHPVTEERYQFVVRRTGLGSNMEIVKDYSNRTLSVSSLAK